MRAAPVLLLVGCLVAVSCADRPTDDRQVFSAYSMATRTQVAATVDMDHLVWCDSFRDGGSLLFAFERSEGEVLYLFACERLGSASRRKSFLFVTRATQPAAGGDQSVRFMHEGYLSDAVLESERGFAPLDDAELEAVKRRLWDQLSSRYDRGFLDQALAASESVDGFQPDAHLDASQRETFRRVVTVIGLDPPWFEHQRK